MPAIPSRAARSGIIKSALLSSDDVVIDRWWDRAKCRGHDPDLWFPSDEKRSGYKHARRICARCPVQLECLEDAVISDSRYGMFGGLTPTERARIKDPRIIRHPR